MLFARWGQMVLKALVRLFGELGLEEVELPEEPPAPGGS
jgi:hypothetical protein